MKQIFIKTFFYLFLLVMVSCQTSTSPIHENEKTLVGSWMKPVNNGQVQGLYMEFREDRTGVLGTVLKVNDNLELPPYMSLQVKDWRVQSDTLSIRLGMQSGWAASGPDGKKIEQNNKPSYAHYLVREVSQTEIVLEDLSGALPVKERFKKVEKIEIIK